MYPLFQYEIEISLFTLKLTHKDCHSVLKFIYSFIYLFVREREREKEREIKVRFFEFCVLLNGRNSPHLNVIFPVQVFLVATNLPSCVRCFFLLLSIYC